MSKAEGNPFFVEEVVKSLQELGAIRRHGEPYVLARPLEEIIVPDVIQDVIMARIDRLEEAPKKTLRGSFHPPAVRAEPGSGLSEGSDQEQRVVRAG